jgi:hypothetical protein
MFRRSQRNLGAKLERRLHNSHVIGGDDDAVKDIRFKAALPYVLDQRFPGDAVQSFTGEAGRAPAGWDDGGDPAHEPKLLIDSTGKDKLGVGKE